MLLEGAERLLHKLPTVREEENTLDALLALKQFHQGDGDAGLAGAGGEHHEETPPGGFDSLGNGLDRLDLISAINDALEWHCTRERFPELVEVGEPQQVFLGEESADLPRRVEASMPEPDFVTIGQKYKGIDAVFGSQRIA